MRKHLAVISKYSILQLVLFNFNATSHQSGYHGGWIEGIQKIISSIHPLEGLPVVVAE